jgi:Polyketide cyclase / dehydrase and lipid transport
MSRIEITESAAIDAAPGTVFDLIADYHGGHPRILPPQYFTPLTVESGGIGEGTVIRFGMKMGGRTQMGRAAVSVPEPGRTLVERVLDLPNPVTTFTVDSLDDGRRCRLTIHTEWEPRGLRGLIERFAAPGFLHKVYRAELARLQEVVRTAAEPSQ